MAQNRALMPDLVRAFALIGIAIVNVGAFAWPFTTYYYDGGLDTPADQATFFGVNALLSLKSYPLFAMMFGAGLAYQFMAAERDGTAFTPRYVRRMFALMVLGVLHFIFFWIGDILLTYGLLGLLFLTCRNLSPRALSVTGIVLISINTLLLALMAGAFWLGETFAPEDMAAEAGFEEMEAAAMAAFSEGTFVDAAAYRYSQLAAAIPSMLLQQGIAAFGFFCFGLALVKTGAIDNPAAPVWRTARRIWLPIGLTGSVAAAWLMNEAPSMFSSAAFLGMTIMMGFSAFSALGYAGLIARLSEGPPGPLRRFLARAGSASLSAYLLQSVLFSLIFSAYGLDLFATLTAWQASATALAVAVISLIAMSLWRARMARGPMEVVLRAVTYGRRG